MKKRIMVCLIFLFACRVYCRKAGRQLADRQKECEKYLDNYQMLNHWLASKNAGSNADAYFEEKGYQSIAIYGMGDLANRLWEELAGSKIEVLYGIDKDVCNTVSRMRDIYSLKDKLPKVDAVIVTPFYAMDDIKESLKTKVDCPVISLEEVIWSM